MGRQGDGNKAKAQARHLRTDRMKRLWEEVVLADYVGIHAMSLHGGMDVTLEDLRWLSQKKKSEFSGLGFGHDEETSGRAERRASGGGRQARQHTCRPGKNVCRASMCFRERTLGLFILVSTGHGLARKKTTKVG